MSSLFYCHFDFLALGGFYVHDRLMTLVSLYAPALSVKQMFCGRLLRPTDPLTLDPALLYAAFDKFAEIESISCETCATDIENALRNLCTAKQIPFATL